MFQCGSEAFVFAVAARQIKIKMVEIKSRAVAFVSCIVLETRMKMNLVPPLVGTSVCTSEGNTGVGAALLSPKTRLLKT